MEERGKEREREREARKSVEKRLNSADFQTAGFESSLYFATLENTPGRIRDRSRNSRGIIGPRFKPVPPISSPDPPDPVADCLTTSFLSYPIVDAIPS